MSITLKLTRQQAALLQYILENWITDTSRFKREERILEKLREARRTDTQ